MYLEGEEIIEPARGKEGRQFGMGVDLVRGGLPPLLADNGFLPWRYRGRAMKGCFKPCRKCDGLMSKVSHEEHRTCIVYTWGCGYGLKSITREYK